MIRNVLFLLLMVVLSPVMLLGAAFQLAHWGFELGRSACASVCHWVLS